MKKYASILVVALVLGMLPGAVSSDVIKEVAPAPVIEGAPAEQQANFTKIEISPQYGSLRLQPGENKELIVTVRNKEKKEVNVNPKVIALPYGGYMVDTEWITVTPDSTKIPAGGSQKFKVKLSVPEDASVGNSGLQVAFTDEIMPTPYPQPVPIYVHAFQLSVEVWTPPKLQIIPNYINDQLEAGKEYDFEIKLKNTGDKPISIDPKLESEPNYGYVSYPQGTAATLNEDSITITSPGSVPAGATEKVNIHIKVPKDAKGYYNGYVNLGIDDPSVREWEGRVNLNLNMWKQPTEPYVKTFSLNGSTPITIEISSNSYFGYPDGKRGGKTPEPSFETSLEGPEGKVELTVTKIVTKGNVNMGGDSPPWEAESESIYQETGVQRIETYRANGSIGDWKLKVLPRNTQGFEYSIIIGE